MIQPTTSIQRLITLLSLTGVLWLNFAYIEHQYDFHPEHHNHHQCQLFSAMGNGLTNVMPDWSNDLGLDTFSPIYASITIAIPFHAYLARSPPHQLISKH